MSEAAAMADARYLATVTTSVRRHRGGVTDIGDDEMTTPPRSTRAISPPSMLPAAIPTAWHPEFTFRGSIAQPARALSTLRRRPRRQPRMTRGRRGSVPLRVELLHLLVHGGLSRAPERAPE